MRIAVIGLGSIGWRHLQNLKSLGCDTLGWDITSKIRNPWTMIEESDGVVIATPPDSHLLYARVAFDKPLFIEKPLGTAVVGWSPMLASHQAPVLIGYPRIYADSFLRFRDRARDPYLIDVSYRQDLALRPQPPWLFTSPQGDVILEQSHAIDLAYQLVGDLTVTHATLRWIANPMMDYAHIVFDMGTITMDYFANPAEVGVKVLNDQGWFQWDHTLEEDHNAKYLEEMRHFLKVVEGKEDPRLDGWYGLKILETIEQCRTLSR